MAKDLDKVRTPEEKELEENLAELAALKVEIAQRELELTTLTTELSEFEARYLGAVGLKFAELDALTAEIADHLVSLDPADGVAEAAAQAAREQAERSAKEAGTTVAPTSTERFAPTKELQELYRDLAKKVHPDLAIDEDDRDRRNRIMAEVNRAYTEGDMNRLREILEDWQSSPEAIQGEDVGARLVRAIRMIARVKQRISLIDEEMQSFMTGELYELKLKVDEAEQEGLDFIEQLIADIDAQIELARSRLEELQAI